MVAMARASTSTKKIKILSLSDESEALIYSPRLKVLFNDVNLVVGCGDLPYHYLDYVMCHLNKPLVFVQGNHVQYQGNVVASGSEVHGGVDVHCRVIREQQMLIAGVAGSLVYSQGPYQYTQTQMWLHVLHLVPRLLLNRVLYGRYLDLFVTHAPPWGIHDQPDLAHQGIKAFLWLDRQFQPSLHIHGHIHYYHPDTVVETRLGNTLVMNAFRYRRAELEIPFKD